MPDAYTFAAVTVAALLGAWAAKRDLQLRVSVTLALFATASLAVTISMGVAFLSLAALILICLFIVETDRRHQLIPDALVIAIVVLSFVAPFSDAIETRIFGALALGGTFFLLRFGGTKLRRVEALGLGDVKLAAAMGALLGPLYGFAAVAIAGLATIAVVGANMRGGVAVAGAPFGIGLAAATIAVSLIRTFAL